MGCLGKCVGSCGKKYGGYGGRCREVCWEVRKDVWGVEKCGRVYGVIGEVCWRVGKGCGERNGGGVGKCVGIRSPNTLPPTLPNISSLTSSPHLSLHLPLPPHTPTHFSTPPLIPLPTSSLPTPHPNTFSYYPHISPHLLKVWRSYHVMKFLWRSYWQPSTGIYRTVYVLVCKFKVSISPKIPVTEV